MSDVKQEVEAAAKAEVQSVGAKIVAFVRANAFKASAVSAFVGAVAGHFVKL